jgi:hypothetical protein
MNKDEQEYLDAQEGQQLRATAQQAGLRAAVDQQEHTVHNEQFLQELRSVGLDSETFNWIEEERPSWFADVHAVTNRGDDWDLEADLIMQNKRERAVTENRPGRLLRDRPFLLATMQGAETPQLDAYSQSGIPGSEEYWRQKTAPKQESRAPVTSEEMSRIYGAAEAAANLMVLSRNGAGLESVSTVKTETNVRREQEEEGAASKMGRVLE